MGLTAEFIMMENGRIKCTRSANFHYGDGDCDAFRNVFGVDLYDVFKWIVTRGHEPLEKERPFYFIILTEAKGLQKLNKDIKLLGTSLEDLGKYRKLIDNFYNENKESFKPLFKKQDWLRKQIATKISFSVIESEFGPGSWWIRVFLKEIMDGKYIFTSE